MSTVGPPWWGVASHGVKSVALLGQELIIYIKRCVTPFVTNQQKARMRGPSGPEILVYNNCKTLMTTFYFIRRLLFDIIPAQFDETDDDTNKDDSSGG